MPPAIGMMLGCVLLIASTLCANAGPPPSPQHYRSLYAAGIEDDTGRAVPFSVRNGIGQQFRTELERLGFQMSERSAAQAELRTRIVSCESSPVQGSGFASSPSSPGTSACLIAAVLVDIKTGYTVTNWIMTTPGLFHDHAPPVVGMETAAFAHEMAEQTAGLLSRAQSPRGASAGEDLTASGAHVVHEGDGVFAISGLRTHASPASATTIVDLKRIRHGHDPAIDKDVAYYTNVTLNDVVPALADKHGIPYAQITVYHVNPPLAGLPSRETGVDRGMDFRTPADLVQSAYSNYVSPVLTNDAERRRIPSHPIGHFLVKIEIPGYPTLLTGMTTIERSDAELWNMTISRELGIGGVLLTPQPGRLESAMEVASELAFRQRELRVVDGLYYEPSGGRNIGPEYVQRDGNVVFARFKVPVANAKDALAYFAEFVARGGHNTFGSLVNRPNKGTGSGCAAFAISLLQAAGVIPFLVEPVVRKELQTGGPTAFNPEDFWKYFLQRIDIPWRLIGCDERLGAGRVVAAKYTIHDLLFHGLPRRFIEKVAAGLAQRIKGEYGIIIGTLFEFGALTPVLDIVVHSKRNDPHDLGDYRWSSEGKGLRAQYWDGSRFFHWISLLWLQGTTASNMSLLREGRFKGIEIDATVVARQRDVFFHEADELAQKKSELAGAALHQTGCEQLFSLDIE